MNTDESIPVIKPNDHSFRTMNQRPSSVRYVFIILGLVQILFLVVLLVGYAVIMNEPSPKENLEFNLTSGGLMMLIALFIGLPVLGIVSLIILVGLPIYLYTHRTNTGLNLYFAIASILLSFVLVAYWMWRLLPFSSFNTY